MQQNKLTIREFETRDLASKAAAEMLSDVLSREIESGKRASFLSSGGSTPIALLENMSGFDLDWSKVDVGLVDERCVSADHSAANAGLIKRHLLHHYAEAATFVPMFQMAQKCDGVTEIASKLYDELMPPSAMLLGMGADGHTASWFAGAKNIEDAFGAKDQCVVKINARGCSVAGEVTDRLTLTRSAVASANFALLLIFGEEKKQVLLDALSMSVDEMPIRAAVEDLGDRLVTVWAP